jgi:hypothetical protein
MTSKPQPDFDLDLKFGEVHEEMLWNSLSKKGNVTVEVKTDRIAHRTGNLAVEYMYNGKPSGILTTKADEWFFVVTEPDGETVRYRINASTKRIKKIAKARFDRGDRHQVGDKAEVVLVPVVALLGDDDHLDREGA